jgi:hypothetical protein
MLKIEIWPSFHNRSSIELKHDGEKWSFIFIKESYEHSNDPGKVWFTNSPDEVAAKNLIELANLIIDAPTEFKYVVINDGAQVRLKIKREGKEFVNEFNCPEKDTREFKFTQDLLRLLEKTFPDSECLDYLELIGEYFYVETIQIKEFDEQPFRLRIYGSPHISKSYLVAEKLELLRAKENPILDMSNFHSVARELDKNFLSLQNIEGLQILTNKHSEHYLKLIGFDMSKTQRVK